MDIKISKTLPEVKRELRCMALEMGIDLQVSNLPNWHSREASKYKPYYGDDPGKTPIGTPITLSLVLSGGVFLYVPDCFHVWLVDDEDFTILQELTPLDAIGDVLFSKIARSYIKNYADEPEGERWLFVKMYRIAKDARKFSSGKFSHQDFVLYTIFRAVNLLPEIEREKAFDEIKRAYKNKDVKLKGIEFKNMSDDVFFDVVIENLFTSRTLSNWEKEFKKAGLLD